MEFKHIQVPEEGEIIHFNSKNMLIVPNNPIVPYIEGDGIGSDITPAMISVVDAAISKAYSNKKKISWMEIFCGEKAVNIYGEGSWLPSETLLALQNYLVGIKGPLTTPVGGGIRSLNVALRQKLDLYVCQRPIRYFEGVPSPVISPEKTDMVIFRENSEDIYAGIEWEADSDEAKKLVNFLILEMGVTKIRFPDNCGIGIKPVSKEGTQRLVDKAIKYAIDNNRSSVTFVHKGNIMKFTEGSFKDWGYQLAVEKYNGVEIEGGPWCKIINPINNNDIIIKDIIADAFLQQILTRPDEYSVIATLNLNGDYISDALAAEVGGIGIAPGANLGDKIALFEATHGTAPKYTGLDKVNPGSLILSAEMMLRHIGWGEAADLIVKGLSKTIKNKTVTYDFERLMSGANLVKCSEFAEAIVDNMD